MVMERPVIAFPVVMGNFAQSLKSDLHEISLLEKDLKSRKESREAKAKVLSNK